MSNTYDAIVIGGGPGGSTISTLLAKAKRKVLLIEREHFPRYHIGESLLAGTADLMKKIGVLEKIENSDFIKKQGVTWVWGAQSEPWTVYFRDALATPFDHGYQVERGAFDKMLLDNARENGVEVLEGHSVNKVKWEDGRTKGVEYESVATAVRASADAPWIIDASGQANFITKQVGKKAWDEKLQNMALWSYWKNAKRLEGEDAGNIFLPAFSDGWWWFIPLRNDITSIGAVLDKNAYAEAKKQGLKEYYVSAVHRTPALAERLQSAEMVEEMRITMDWSYKYDAFSGNGFIAVGDAACFIDPLLSTGVHLAMLSAFLGAVSVNTLLDQPEAERPILDFYQEQYTREYQRLRDQVYFLYGGHRSADSYFWHARRTMDLPAATPKEAFVSLIAGAFEHRAWFRTFISNLEVPDSLRALADGFLKTMSSGLQSALMNAPLTKNPAWRTMPSYAIDGLSLRSAEIYSPGGGLSLPLTEALGRVLSAVDGRKTTVDIMQAADGDDASKDRLRLALNEALMYGAIVPAKASTQA